MNERMQGGGGAGSDFGGVGGSDGMSADQRLPTSWMETTLDTLLHRIEAGLNVKCDERPPNVGEKGLVKISAVTWGQFDELQSKTLPASETPVPRNRIQPGDLLISRANTIELVGASVIVKDLQRELYLSDKVLRLVVHEPSKRWINYALKTPALRKAIEEGSSGNQLSMRNISQDKLKALPLPLAPEAEQKRIADKLDTVLTRVDAVNIRLARVAPLLKRFRQSVLAAATSGRLTEDWRGEAMDWSSVPAAEICEKVQSGGTPKAGFAEAGVPFLKVYNIVDQRVAFDYKPQFVSQAIHESELRKSQVFPNDVLMNIVGPPLGKVAVVPADHSAWNINQAITLFRPSSKITSQWIYILLCEGAPIRDVLARTKGSVGQVNISLSQCRAFEFQVPSVEEQTEIVRRVETLFAFADRLEARLAQAQTAATRLTPALLAKAFRGELVPQDPNDEPAAELLRRLQAERATAVSASKTGTGRGRGRTAVAAPAVTEN